MSPEHSRRPERRRVDPLWAGGGVSRPCAIFDNLLSAACKHVVARLDECRAGEAGTRALGRSRIEEQPGDRLIQGLSIFLLLKVLSISI